MLNRALSITRLADLSSIYVPIYTPTHAAVQKCGLSPFVQFNDLSRYHTSAMIASAIESNSLPYRLKHNPMTMADTVSKLNWVRSTNLASLSVCLPLPISETGYTGTLEDKQPLKPTLPLLDRMSTHDVSWWYIYGPLRSFIDELIGKGCVWRSSRCKRAAIQHAATNQLSGKTLLDFQR